MSKKLVVAAVITLTACTATHTPEAVSDHLPLDIGGPGSGRVEPPPPEYDYEPTIPYRVLRVGQIFLRNKLPWVSQNDLVYGYTAYYENPPTIYVWEHLQGGELAEVLRHEKGHINGWRHHGPTIY